MLLFFFFFLETTWFWAKKTFEFPISAEKSVSILVKTFFFLETTWFWAKKTFEFPISAEKSLSILVKTSEFLRFWLQIPPHQNFLDPPLLRCPVWLGDLSFGGGVISCNFLSKKTKNIKWNFHEKSYARFEKQSLELSKLWPRAQ